MQHLEQQIKTVEGAQKELSQSAEALLQEQESFMKILKDKTTTKLPESTDQRQRLYRLAHELSDSFLDMEKQLKSIVEQTEGGSHMETASDIGKIEHVANCHLDAMRWIEHQSSILEEKLENLNKKVANNQ